MNKIIKYGIYIVFLINSSFNFSQENEKFKYQKVDLSMFPKAVNGYKQIVLNMPIIKNEQNYRVEVFIGSEQLVDCNNQILIGDINNQILEGFQYPYFIIESNGLIASTLAGCPDQTKTKRFVYLQPQLLNYNSNFPHIFYIPENFEIKYRIWRADKKIFKISSQK
jgi:ecotin